MSDRLNVEPSDFGLDFILKLKPCSWNWKAPLSDGKTHFGLISQDVDKIAPKDDFGFVGSKEGWLTINYIEFIGPLIRAVQQVHEENIELKKQLSDIEDKINKKQRKIFGFGAIG